MDIFAEVTAQISENYLKKVVSTQNRSQEGFFTDIAKEAGLKRSYGVSASSWFLQGSLDSVTKAHSLLESVYNVWVAEGSGSVGDGDGHVKEEDGVEDGKHRLHLLETKSPDDVGDEGGDEHRRHQDTEEASEVVQEITKIPTKTKCDVTTTDKKAPPEDTNGLQSHGELEESGIVLKSRTRRRGHKRKSAPRRFVQEDDDSGEDGPPPTKTKPPVKSNNNKSSAKKTIRPKRAPKTRKQSWKPKLPKTKNQNPSKSDNDNDDDEDIDDKSSQSDTQRLFRSGPKTCSICSKAFSKMSNMYRHMKIAHQGYRFPCSVCRKKFTCKDSLDRHTKIVHEGLRCGECTVLFDSPEALKEHQDNDCPGDKSKLQMFTCRDCGRNYSRQSNLNKHVRVAHKGLMYQCEFCCRGYRSKEGVLEHQRHVHNMYKCNRCDIVHECEMDFKMHLEDVHQETYIIRPLPRRKGQAISGPRKRKKHPAACDQCGKVYSSKSKLNNHIRVIHQGIHQQCEQCTKSFASKEQLKIHFRVFHEGLEFNCSMCSRTYTNRVTLAKHQQAVHKQLLMDNVYQCEICGKSFLYECNLCRHKKLEHEGLRFPCKECDKEFRSKQKMQEHQMVEHEGHRFLCPHCSKMFKNKSKLKEHEISTHTSLKPYQCTVCEETFARRSSLNYHVKRKHAPGGRPTSSTVPKKAKPPSIKPKKGHPTEGKKSSTSETADQESQNVGHVFQGPYINGTDRPTLHQASEEGYQRSTAEERVVNNTNTPTPVQAPLLATVQAVISKAGSTTWHAGQVLPQAPPPEQQPGTQQSSRPTPTNHNYQRLAPSLDLLYPQPTGQQVSSANITMSPPMVNNQADQRSSSSQEQNLILLSSAHQARTDKVTLETVLRRNNNHSWPSQPVPSTIEQPLPTVHPGVDPTQGLYNQALQNLLSTLQPAFGGPPSQPQPVTIPDVTTFPFQYPSIPAVMPQGQAAMPQGQGDQHHPQ